MAISLTVLCALSLVLRRALPLGIRVMEESAGDSDLVRYRGRVDIHTHTHTVRVHPPPTHTHVRLLLVSTALEQAVQTA